MHTESCFLAEVEELCIKNGSQGIKESITTLRNKVEKWIQYGELGEDFRFENSTFKKLLGEHSLPI
jgi:enhanced disease susceptibility 1 protein